MNRFAYLLIGLALAAPLPAAAQPLLRPVEAGADAPEAVTSAASAELVLDTQGFRGLVSSVALSPSGKLLAAAGGKEVRIWETDTGRLRQTLRGERERNDFGTCYTLAFSPDGRHLLVGIHDFQHPAIRVYDTQSLTLERVFGAKEPCRQLAFSRDGRYLAAAGAGGKIQLWRWRDGRLMGTIEPSDSKQPLYSLFDFPTADSLLYVRDSGGPALYSVPLGVRQGRESTPQTLRQWQAGMNDIQFPYAGGPQNLCLRLEQGVWLASGKGGAAHPTKYWVALFRDGAPQPALTYGGHRYVVSAMALSADNSLVASADVFGDVHLWDARTGEQRFVFDGLGAPVYEVHFDRFDQREQCLAFGTRPATGAAWAQNHYGDAEASFSFNQRAMVALAGEAAASAAGPAAKVELATNYREGNYYIVSQSAQRGFKPYRVRAGAMPTVFSVLPADTLDLEVPVLLGDDGGDLRCFNPKADVDRRQFVGHEMFVTAANRSPDGRFLVTGSTDRTIRLWSLENFQSLGALDCKIISNTIIEIKPRSHCERAGLKVGDKVLTVGGMDWTQIDNALLRGTYPFRPEDEVEVTFERGSRSLSAQVTLHEENDVVEPLLSLFVTEQGEWIIWTPQGYYDASPGADALLGWHVNQGHDRDAKYFPADTFKRQLYRPDIIDQVLQTGDVSQAIRNANLAIGLPVDGPDLRNADQLAELAPPVVKITKTAAPDQTGRIRIAATVSPTNTLPVTGATFLLNGRPIKAALPVEGGRAQQLNQEIDLLPGRNEIEVFATNKASTSAREKITVDYEPPAGTKDIRPNLYLLSIGISKYQDASLNGLQYPAHDAEQFVAAIKRQEGGLYGKVESQLLTDAEATRGKMLEGMDWLLKSVTQRDVAMIFLSSHGFRDSQNNFFLGTHDIKSDSLRASGLSHHDFLQVVQDLPCKVVVFADACHSAGITGAKLGFDDPLRDLVGPETGAVLFCSSSARQISLEHADWGHGAFTKALLDSLREKGSDRDTPPDGYLTVFELSFNIDEQVKKLTRGQQKPRIHKPATVPDFNVFRLPTPDMTSFSRSPRGGDSR